MEERKIRREEKIRASQYRLNVLHLVTFLPGLTPGLFYLMRSFVEPGHPASGVLNEEQALINHILTGQNVDSYKFTVMMGILFGDGCAHDLVDSGPRLWWCFIIGFSGADIGCPPGDSPDERHEY